ncbi:hypothetical protein [Maribacter sp. 2307UL18-2]|uniref:hypothetical protein n=1 Tax=Maribacter sp. 2307UL18-2 TaxID=3386274 RepID=UPI0039BD0BA7
MSDLFQYRPLFNVEILIDYYLSEEVGLFQNTSDNPMEDVLAQQMNRYRIDRDFRIVPTADTLSVLRDYRLQFKRNNSGFFVSGQATSIGGGSFTPFTAMNEAFSLRFAVYLENPYFYNFTNLRLESDLDDKDRFVYYFSNRANNVDGGVRYLTLPIRDFDSTYAYEASELFIDTSDPLNPAMFEAIENNGPGVFNNANWRQIFTGVNPLSQFVTNDDRIVLRPFSFKHDVESVGAEFLQFQINDIQGTLVKTLNYRTPEAGIPLRFCELDLIDLAPGYYQMVVQDALANPLPELSLTFFIDNVLSQERPFAIIECFHEPEGSLGAYRWLDQNNQNGLLFPEYTLRWKNRSTWWRYYHEESPNLVSPVLQNLDPIPNTPNNRILISTTPLALTQVGREIPVTYGNGDLGLFPNPDIQMIYPENGRIFSELDMGGGFGPPV